MYFANISEGPKSFSRLVTTYELDVRENTLLPQLEKMIYSETPLFFFPLTDPHINRHTLFPTHRKTDAKPFDIKTY